LLKLHQISALCEFGSKRHAELSSDYHRFFDQIKGADGIVRQIEWTARVEGSGGTANGSKSDLGVGTLTSLTVKDAMTMSQYLGRGTVSRGRMTITKALTTVVSTLPYLQDKNDVLAVIQGIKNLQDSLKNVKNLTWALPAPGTTAEDFVNNVSFAPFSSLQY
jgi:cellobiose dehydrogenase (acceptor)